MGIYKFLYLRNGELILNFGTGKTYKVYTLIYHKHFQVNLDQSTKELNIV